MYIPWYVYTHAIYTSGKSVHSDPVSGSISRILLKPQALNKAGFYLRSYFIQGNTVHVFGRRQHNYVYIYIYIHALLIVQTKKAVSRRGEMEDDLAVYLYNMRVSQLQ